MSGEYISKEQFYKLCHISKRTALWLIQSGLVEAIDTGRKTDRYLIPRHEVERYLRCRELHPTTYRYVRPGEASPVIATQIPPTKVEQAQTGLQRVLADVPDLLRLQDVAELLGYPQKRVRNWLKVGKMEGMMISHTLYFPKGRMIELVLSPTVQEVTPKSEKHLELLRRIGYARE